MLRKLRKNMKAIIIIVAVVFGTGMFAGLGYRGFRGFRERKVGIATVDGREIDRLRFNQNLSRLVSSLPGRRKPQEVAYLQMLALSQVVDFTIMLNEAKRHVRVSGREVDATISQIMETNKIPSKAGFEEALKRNNLTVKQFKKMLKEDILIQKMVARVKGGVTLAPEDLREIHAAHILIAPETPLTTIEAERDKLEEKAEEDARQLAEELLLRVKKGEDFARLAKDFSDDPVSSDSGGDLGFFATGRMVPEFERVAFALKPGEVSDVVKTQIGYHIIKVLDTRLRQVAEKDKDKDLKEVILAEKKEKAFSQWLFSLKQKVTVEIINPILRAYDFRLKGQVDAAIAEYNIAISENPSDAYLHLLLGDTYEQKDDIDMAIAEYIKATSLNTSDPDIAIILGNAYERAEILKNDKTGKYRKLALEQYKKASILSGEVKELHEEIADIYEELGEKILEKAERDKIAQIERKEKFEEEIRKKVEEEKVIR